MTMYANGRVNGNVSWPSKVKVMASICVEPIFSKTSGDQLWLYVTLNVKVIHMCLD